MFDRWANELKPTRPGGGAATWEAFKQAMYGGEFLFNVSRDFVVHCATSMLVLPGNEVYHPESSWRELAALAPHATLIEHWKEPQHQIAAQKAAAPGTASGCCHAAKGSLAAAGPTLARR